MEHQKRVCVIGAGLSGLPVIKCMNQAGLKVTCFEKEFNIAGRWHKNTEHAVPRSTITNLTRNLSCYSDFPVPDEFPLYFSADTFCKYLELYADNFGLRKYIKLGCNVVNLAPASKELCPGWRVTYRDAGKEELEQEEFDFVVLASGFYRKPYVPAIIEEKLASFKGRVIHSIDYTGWKEFENETVVVCGLGNTGGDVASEISDHGKQVYISTSHGALILNRILNGGVIPTELSRVRFSQYLPALLKKKLSSYVATKMSNAIYNQEKLCLSSPKTASVIMNDEICIRVASGKIKVKPSIEKSDGNTIYFSNGTVAENVDTVVLCTGYQRHFPYFEAGIIPLEHNGKHIPLYKNIFTTKFRESLAFVGMCSVFGSTTLTSEMQARYAAEVFKKNISLPSSEKMEGSILAAKSALHYALGNDLKEYNFHSNPWTYYDSLATEVGCRPSMLWVMLTDPVLAWHLVSTYSPFEYRLYGPHSWSGARQAIMDQFKVMYAFMNGSRDVPNAIK